MPRIKLVAIAGATLAILSLSVVAAHGAAAKTATVTVNQSTVVPSKLDQHAQVGSDGVPQALVGTPTGYHTMGNPIGGANGCMLTAGYPHVSTSTPGFVGAKANVSCGTTPTWIAVQVTLWQCPFPGTVVGFCANEFVAAYDFQRVDGGTYVEAQNAYIPFCPGVGEFWASVDATSVDSEGNWGGMHWDSGWQAVMC